MYTSSDSHVELLLIFLPFYVYQILKSVLPNRIVKKCPSKHDVNDLTTKPYTQSANAKGQVYWRHRCPICEFSKNSIL